MRRWVRESTDRLLGADPGLTQLRAAAQAILGIVVAVGLIYVFVRLTGALQLPAGAAPEPVRAATNHALLIVSMLVGGIMAMMAGFVVNDVTPRQQLISTLLLPFPMLGAITLGLLLGEYRVPSLIYLVVLMTASVYVRRWGPRGFAAGLVAFNGGFLGFFLHAQLKLSDVGWLAADIGLGMVASLLVRFVVLRDDQESKLERMRGSWLARSRRLLDLGVDVLATPHALHRPHDDDRPDPREEQTRRQVVRLNESTLIVEAQLVLTSPTSARLEAQELFGAELSLTNCARFAVALARTLTPRDAALRVSLEAALAAARDERWHEVAERAEGLRALTGSSDRVTTLVRRLATSLQQYATSRDRLHQAIADRRAGTSVATFEPAVELLNGYLPGSVPISAQASITPGRGRFERSVMPPYVRASIQIAVAATLAVVIGDLVDGFRLYWAVLAAFLAFMATTNTGEQVRKALFRVAGTAIGIVIGDLLVRATGGRLEFALPVVLVVLFLGIYLIRTNYTFMVIGVTMMLSLIYYQLGEFSWDLLVLRLVETAVGVGVVVVTVLVVFPLRPQRVLVAGVLLWFRSLAELVDHAMDRLLGNEVPGLRGDIRTLDASWAALEATAQPLRRATFGRNSTQLAEVRAVASAARYYARSLADAVDEIGAPVLPELRDVARDLRGSLAAIDARLESGQGGTYTRVSALVDRASRSLPDDDSASCELLRLALRDLTLLDGTLARLAAALDMAVRDYDTSDLVSA